MDTYEINLHKKALLYLMKLHQENIKVSPRLMVGKFGISDSYAYRIVKNLEGKDN